MYDRFTDLLIKPINWYQRINLYRPINQYRPIADRRSHKSQYWFGIGSADYKGQYRLIGSNYYNQFFAWNVPKISKIKSKILVYNIWSPQRILTPYNIWSPMKNLDPSDKFDFKIQFQTLYLSVSDQYQIGIGSVSDRYHPIWKKTLLVIYGSANFENELYWCLSESADMKKRLSVVHWLWLIFNHCFWLIDRQIMNS